MTGKAQITIEIDPAALTSYTASHLAMLWHVAQANPADGFAEQTPGELAEKIGWEIIRRWLAETPAEMYHHQGGHYYWNQLRKFATFNGTEWVVREPDAAEGPAGELEAQRTT